MAKPSGVNQARTRCASSGPNSQKAILTLLSDGEAWTNAELKRRIPSILSLSPADRVRSSTRPNEERWEELVNNALSQAGRSNSLYAKGLVSKVGFGLHKLSGPENGQVGVEARQQLFESSTHECNSITGRPEWVKVVGFLEHNWAVEDSGSAARVWFIDDASGVFDQVELSSRSNAESALMRNGFRPKRSDARFEAIAPRPPLKSSRHPNGTSIRAVDIGENN